MRWWGWGEDSGAITLPDSALALLREELGMDGSETGARVELDEVELPAPALPDGVRRELDDAGLSEDHADRVSHTEVCGGLLLEGLDVGAEDEPSGVEDLGDSLLQLVQQRRVLRPHVNQRDLRHDEPV